MIVRDETAADWQEIDRLVRAAFGGSYESDLIARLRQERLVVVGLVAEAQGQIVGHIMLSWLPTQVDGRVVRATALAPMAVRIDQQRRGIGSRLVASSIERATQAGVEAIIVLGHPTYYPRFGFSADLASKLAAPFSGSAFMALELAPGTLSGSRGTVVYPKAFGL
jgi:putative acetyltransferase